MRIDEIIRSKRRTIALIVDHDGKLIVRAPLRTTLKQIETLVEQKAGWIRSKQELTNTTYARFTPKDYVNGEWFLYLGKAYRLAIVNDSDQSLRLADQFYLSKSVLGHAEQVFKGWYILHAKVVINERVQWHAANHGFKYRQVNITNAQARWGSCSPRGNLNFSWRLVMAPMQAIDYVVVHELVHLHEKNHSRRFWDKVKIILPDYTSQVKWLKTCGHMLRLAS
jgi:predicted metal-dependent hydrolase